MTLVFRGGPRPASFVRTAFAFMGEGGAEKRLVIGAENVVVVGFVNNGDTSLNVSGIIGSVNAAPPLAFRHYMQNLSAVLVNETVEPGQEVTFAYPFILHPKLEADPYVLAFTVFYSDGEEAYTSTFFNDTVTLVHRPLRWDAV